MGLERCWRVGRGTLPLSLSFSLDLSLLLPLNLCPSSTLSSSLPVSSISPSFGLFLSLWVSAYGFPSLPASLFPSPWAFPFFGCPQPCSVCLGTASPTLCSAHSQQRPSPMAAAPLAQGPALTVTHRADGGDFDEEATPPPAGALVCVCLLVCMCMCARPAPLRCLLQLYQEGAGSRGPPGPSSLILGSNLHLLCLFSRFPMPRFLLPCGGQWVALS